VYATIKFFPTRSSSVFMLAALIYMS